MEIVGVLAAVFELAAIYLIGIKNKAGFIFGIFGNITWVAYSYATNSAFGLVLVSACALFLNIKGYRLWRK